MKTKNKTQVLLEVLLVVVVLLVLVKANYDHKNQALWSDLDNAECHMQHQSPIELSSYESSLCSETSSIYFHNFHVPYKTSSLLLNNGHTVAIQLPSDNSTFMAGGPLPNNIYFSESIHFHWGSRDTHGSEHVVDSRRFSMELHLVHRNSKYRNINEAIIHEDGLAVLAVFYDVEPSQPIDFDGLNNIIKSLAAIENYNTSTAVYSLTLSELFDGINIEDYFTYKGSLTMPPCSEAVTWIVFRQAIRISPNQMAHFRLLHDKEGDVLANNYRHLQARGLRTVCRKYDCRYLGISSKDHRNNYKSNDKQA